MIEEPAIRAAITIDHLETIRATEPHLLAQIASVAPPGTLDAMNRMTRLSWIPMRQHMRLAEATRQIIGPWEHRALWRRTALRILQQPGLETLIDGTIRLFGLTPQGLSKVTPRTWGLVSRACGKLTLEPSPAQNQARIVLTDFPPELFATGTFAEGLAGCFEAVYELCDTQGQIIIAKQNLEAGAATFHMIWR